MLHWQSIKCRRGIGVRQGVAVTIDVPIVLASASLSAVLAVITARRGDALKARADRDFAAREAVRAAVRPSVRTLTWARQGVSVTQGQQPGNDADSQAQPGFPRARSRYRACRRALEPPGLGPRPTDTAPAR